MKTLHIRTLLLLVLHLGGLVASSLRAQGKPDGEPERNMHVFRRGQQVWMATVKAGDDKLDVLVYVNSEGYRILKMDRARPDGQSPTPASAVKVTLFTRAGHEITPKPMSEEMVGFTIGHGGMSECLSFLLEGVALDDLQDVQIQFNGKSSLKIKLNKAEE